MKIHPVRVVGTYKSCVPFIIHNGHSSIIFLYSVCKKTQVLQGSKAFFPNIFQSFYIHSFVFFPPSSIRSNSQITLKSENTNKSSSVLHAYMDISLTATIFLDLPKNREGKFLCLSTTSPKEVLFCSGFACYGILAEMVAWLAIYHFECFTVCFICVTRICLALFSEK